MRLPRRSLIVGSAAAIGVGVVATRGVWEARTAPAPQALRFPKLIDVRKQGNSVSLQAGAGRTEFFPGQVSRTLGYNGNYLGPTLRVHRGDEVKVAVTNALSEDTSVHWHGLLIPAEADGGPHQLIRPGDTWRPILSIQQPAATLFYHSHVHGRTGVQVYSGLAGMLLVTDEEEQALGLPSDYGVDDLPLLLQDRLFEDGQLITPAGMMALMEGRRGNATLVNGTPNAVARVPAGLVRLRLVNGSNARIFDLFFTDRRMFQWIGTEGGLLESPVALRGLTLAPGERAEVLVDFSDGQRIALETAPDHNRPMMMGPFSRLRNLPADLIGSGNEIVLQFEPSGAGHAPAVPSRLIVRESIDPSRATRHRRFVLGMGGMMGGGMGGMAAVINGRSFEMERIDESVRLGETEIWEVSGEMMSHPFHIHGVHFEVIRRNGGKPAVRDAGPRDTVLVREPVELLVRFTQPALKAPFMYHCHIFEHEDNGMMGQFATT